MRKSQSALLLTVIFSGSLGLAQGLAATGGEGTGSAQSAQSSAPAAGGGVVIVTQQAAAPVAQQAQQPTQQQYVVEQPTTVVTASPLTTSRADELRKARERMEVETEQKIVEKLETSRLEDEQKRLNNLFGNGQKAEVQQVQQEPAQVVPVQAVPVAAAAVVVEAPQKSEEQLKSEIASQVRADLEAAKNAEDASKSKGRWSVGGMLSTVSYPDAYNVGSDFGVGVTANWIGANRIGVELSALFSQATVDQSYSFFREVDQQNWMMATKYYFMDREFTPVVGGLLSFTHREYTDMYQFYYNNAVSGGNSATTDSLDAGLLVGVQFSPSKSLTFGLDYRWLTNVETRYSHPSAFNRSSYDNMGYYGYKPLEEIDYQFVNLSMSFAF